MNSPLRAQAFPRAAAGLGAAVLVLIVAGAAVASDRQGQGDDRRVPGPTSTTTVPAPAPVAPPTTGASVRAASGGSSTPTTAVASAVPAAPPVTLSYEPMQVAPSTTAPPTTLGVPGGGGLGCHESLVPIPECGTGPYVTEPPP